MEDSDQQIAVAESTGDCIDHSAYSRQQTAFIGQTAGNPDPQFVCVLSQHLAAADGAWYAESSTQHSPDKILGRQRPRPHRLWTERYIKLLVVGDSGLVYPL